MLLQFLKKKILSRFIEETKREQTKLRDKLESLEKEMSELKKRLNTETVNQIIEHPEKTKVIIEHITIENLNIENADLSNNFGQLGIKDLSGQLYIGTTYGAKPHLEDTKLNQLRENEKKNPPTNSPTIYFRAKNEKFKT
jgi:predicted nuclease with TOPRIM domain